MPSSLQTLALGPLVTPRAAPPTAAVRRVNGLRPSPRVVRSAAQSCYREPSSQGRIRVGFIAPHLIPGGAERWMITLARYASSIDWVGCANVGTNGWLDSAVVRELGALMPVYTHETDGRPGGCFGVTERYALARDAVEAVARRADVLLTWGVAELGTHISPSYDGRIVAVSHACDDEWARYVIAQSARDATDHVCVSALAAGPFSAVGVSAVVLENGADEARCAPTMPRERARELCGWSHDDVVIGYLGRFSGEKRPQDAARAVAALRRSSGGERFKCWYVGHGVRASLEEMALHAAELPLGTVRLSLPTPEVGDVLQAMDCLLLTSPSEGFGLTLVEAWLAGVPTVATPVGVAKIVADTHGAVSTSVPVGASPENIADAIKLAMSPANRATVDRARRIAARHYTATAMADRWTAYLHRICAIATSRAARQTNRETPRSV